MKACLGLIFAGVLFLTGCASSSSDDQLPSSPTVSTSNDATSNPADNPAAVSHR